MEEEFLGEEFVKTDMGIYIPPTTQPDQPNRATRRDMMRQIKAHARQEARKQARLKEKNG